MDLLEVLSEIVEGALRRVTEGASGSASLQGEPLKEVPLKEVNILIHEVSHMRVVDDELKGEGPSGEVRIVIEDTGPGMTGDLAADYKEALRDLRGGLKWIEESGSWRIYTRSSEELYNGTYSTVEGGLDGGSLVRGFEITDGRWQSIFNTTGTIVELTLPQEHLEETDRAELSEALRASLKGLNKGTGDTRPTLYLMWNDYSERII